MKYLCVLFATFIISVSVLAQGAGNSFYSQRKAKIDYSESFTQDNFAFDGNYMQGTYSNDNQFNRINDTLLYIDANVLKNVNADSYQIVLGMSQVGEGLDVCHSLLKERINGFVKELAEIGIAEDNLFTDFISQTPIFAIEVEKKLFSKKYVEIPKGFELKKNLHINYNNIEQADRIIELAAKHEIYDIIQVDYIINNIEIVYEELRKECIAIINAKLIDYKDLNVNIEAQYTSLEETHFCSYPIERYSSFVSYTPETYKALSQTATLSHANINLFYNRIPYNKYDKVINPVINEPCVQFSYLCRLEIILKKK
ncbi:MAG: SIMPL domain-containing protein [Bacteroidales bacterium]|nr:SIMPL domain-containing protein [Bacteroidales bacterium]